MDTAVKQTLRLASYNIRAGLGTDLRRDAERAISAIAGLRADILALQEADHRMGERPAALPRHSLEHRTGLSVLPAGQHAGSLGWHGIALLMRPEFVLQDIEMFNLPGLEPRGALIADLDTPFGALRVGAVHLGLMRRSRKAQLAHIRERLDRRSPRPTIVMGDFNEWSRKKGMDAFHSDYSVTTPGPTFPSRLPVVPLDRVAHCRDISAKVKVAHSGGSTHASDHLPIIADITLNRQQTQP
jgi:endonuclease/exonuclease/phosphatase family metal-dependent hydrolase